MAFLLLSDNSSMIKVINPSNSQLTSSFFVQHRGVRIVHVTNNLDLQDVIVFRETLTSMTSNL